MPTGKLGAAFLTHGGVERGKRFCKAVSKLFARETIKKMCGRSLDVEEMLYPASNSSGPILSCRIYGTNTAQQTEIYMETCFTITEL